MNQRRTIGLISDTHGFFHPVLREVFARVERIVHAGDVGRPDVLEGLEAIAPVSAVRGNIDGGALADLPESLILEVGPITIAVLHIAGSPKRPDAAARRLIDRHQPTVFVCGHSHIPVVANVGQTLWINPGAAGNQGFHNERLAALLHIEPDGELALDRVLLGKRGQR